MFKYFSRYLRVLESDWGLTCYCVENFTDGCLDFFDEASGELVGVLTNDKWVSSKFLDKIKQQQEGELLEAKARERRKDTVPGLGLNLGKTRYNRPVRCMNNWTRDNLCARMLVALNEESQIGYENLLDMEKKR